VNRRVICAGLKYWWRELVRTVKAFPKRLYRHKTAENNVVGLLGYYR